MERRIQWARSAAVKLTAFLLIGYLAIGASLYFEQSKLLFPARKTFEKTTPANIGLDFEDLRIPVHPRDDLHAWWILAGSESAKAILVFHGNGYVLEYMVRDEATSLHAIGANLTLVDYRGYGSSSPIDPDESTVDEDAEAALNYLLVRRGNPIGNIFVLGRSIGSGPATDLAMKHPGLAGLILESPFSSVDDAAANVWYSRYFPVRLMLRTHFDNLSKVSAVQVPLLIVSGTKDTLTPPSMAESIFARAHQPKQLHLVAGAGHNDLLAVGGKSLTEVLQKFVEQH